MSRDFILVFSGGVVSLLTTLVVLFVMDYFYRREQKSKVELPTQSAGGHEAVSKNVPVQSSMAKSSDPTTSAVQKAKPHDADSSGSQPVAEAKSAPRVDEKPVQAKVVEHAIQPVADQTPKSRAEGHPVQEPVAETKSEDRASQTAALEPIRDQEPQPASVAAKPKPPHMVPPEKIKKKTGEENAA